MRRLLAVLCAIAACASATSGARAGTFRVLSQNTLHMGWGKAPYQTNKNAYLRVNQVATTYDIVLLQEVMPKLGGLTTVWANAPVGSYYVFQSGAMGASTYRETYGTLVKSSLSYSVAQVGGAYYTCYGGVGFSRPPCAVLVKAGTVYTWFLDYHAIFGSVKDRKTEVGNMNTAVATFQSMNVYGSTYGRVVVGGDWNFSVPELTSILTLTGTLSPDDLTSLNPAGALSSKYDHFWCVGGVACANAVSVNPPPGPYSTLSAFRTNVSDHLAVKVDVTY